MNHTVLIMPLVLADRSGGRLLPQDDFIRRNLTSNDILIISAGTSFLVALREFPGHSGGNDIALKPTCGTICNICCLMSCNTQACINRCVLLFVFHVLLFWFSVFWHSSAKDDTIELYFVMQRESLRHLPLHFNVSWSRSWTLTVFLGVYFVSSRLVPSFNIVVLLHQDFALNTRHSFLVLMFFSAKAYAASLISKEKPKLVCAALITPLDSCGFCAFPHIWIHNASSERVTIWSSITFSA